MTGDRFAGSRRTRACPRLVGSSGLRSSKCCNMTYPSCVPAAPTPGYMRSIRSCPSTRTRPVEPEALRTSLNGLCKPHIVVSEVEAAAADFDARFSCTGRSYRYRVLNQRLPDPFRKDHTWRVSVPLDVERMHDAGQHLLGTHDFSSFCRRQFDTSGEEPVEKPRTRTLRTIEWTCQPDNELHLIISASSFCQQMVRSITGLCVDVGLGSIEPEAVPEILAAKDRTAVPRVAPPQGLFLLQVTY